MYFGESLTIDQFLFCEGSILNACSTYGAVVRSSFLLRIGSDMILIEYEILE